MAAADPEPFALFGRNLFGDEIEQTASGPIAERFTIPPFSVLSARDGDWQDRKAAWLATGIESEVGRDVDEDELDDQDQERSSVVYGVNAHLSPKAQRALGCMASYGATTVKRASGSQTSTSIFDPVLCELAYRWLCPPGGLVLDPFAGGSVRGVVAGLLGYRYHGIELRSEQVAANRSQAARIAPRADIVWQEGDSRAVLADAPDADLVFTCPPYGDLEEYSDLPADLSAMSYADFCAAYRDIITKAVARLKPNRFACVVVGEFRDQKTGIYRGFVPFTAAAFSAAGAAYYNEAILVTCVGSLPIRIGKQFEASRKIGKTHQNVLMFVKGDPRAAVAAINDG